MARAKPPRHAPAPAPGCAKSINLVGYAAAMDPVTTLAPREPEAAVPAPIRKPLPPEHFVDHGTNAEMRWDVPHGPGDTPASRLFVRNHTETAARRGDVEAVRPRRRAGAGGGARWRTCGRCGDAHGLRPRVHRQRAQLFATSRAARRRARRGTSAHRSGGRGGCPPRDVLGRLAARRGGRRDGGRARPELRGDDGVDDGPVRRPLPSLRLSTTPGWRGGWTGSRCCPTTGSRCAWSCPAGSASPASSGSARSRSPPARSSRRGTRSGTA